MYREQNHKQSAFSTFASCPHQSCPSLIIGYVSDERVGQKHFHRAGKVTLSGIVPGRCTITIRHLVVSIPLQQADHYLWTAYKTNIVFCLFICLKKIVSTEAHNYLQLELFLNP